MIYEKINWGDSVVFSLNFLYFFFAWKTCFFINCLCIWLSVEFGDYEQLLVILSIGYVVYYNCIFYIFCIFINYILLKLKFKYPIA